MKKCPKCGKAYEDANTLCPSDGAVLVKSGDSLVGKTLADKYRVEEKISEGGMGAVFRATHVLMEKTVAVKVLHPSLAADEKIVARFTREARAASRISHPHALNVTDFGEAEDGVVFLVMEYLRGQTLKQVVRTEGPLALDRVAEITRQVAGALDAAHAEGVVHRDLKSDNIMLTENGTGGDWAKVLDFGIAKIQEPVGQDPELTAPNLIIGTPQYMSPEQCSQAHEIDARSDIYSLGVIVFEMLTGHVPFTGESATAIMLKHLQEPPPSVLAERPDLPPAVGQVVARALSKRPEDRQQSAGELAEALELAAQGATGAAVATGESRLSADTNRIVVPTSPIEVRPTASEDYDEATVVRPPRTPRTDMGEQEIFEDVIEPPPAASFNPWKVIVPAAVLLVALLGVFYAVSRNSAAPTSAEDSNGSAPLTADPGAQPVQASAPPTGAGEAKITPAQSPSSPAETQSATTEPAQSTTPAAAAVPAQATKTPNAEAEPAASVDPKATPILLEEITNDNGEKPNRNDNRSQGKKDKESGELPSPSPTPNQQRQKTQPTPAREESDDPPPPPSPRKTATPRPTPPSGPAHDISADPPPPRL